MKKIMTRLQLVALFLLSLFFTPTARTADLGVKNKYPIGSNAIPVLAVEYCHYLNDQAGNDSVWIQSPYYDSSFMNTSCGLYSSKNAAIYRTGWSRGYLTGPGYVYKVIPGHERDRIVAVYSEGIQQEFNEWRAQQVINITTPPNKSDTPVDVPTTEPAAPADVPVAEPAAPADVPVAEPAAPADISVAEPAAPVDVPTTEPAAPADVSVTEPAAPADVPVTEPAASVDVLTTDASVASDIAG